MYNIDEILKQITEGMDTPREVIIDLGYFGYYLGLIIIAVDAAAKGRDFDMFSRAFDMLQRAMYSTQLTAVRASTKDDFVCAHDRYEWLKSAVQWVTKKGSRSLNSKIRAIC